jgi:hypothetical protein
LVVLQFGGDGEEFGAFALVIGVKLDVALHVIAGTPIRFFKMWHHLIRKGAKGGGDGVELGAWYAVLNPDKLAVEGFKNSTGGG